MVEVNLELRVITGEEEMGGREGEGNRLNKDCEEEMSNWMDHHKE